MNKSYSSGLFFSTNVKSFIKVTGNKSLLIGVFLFSLILTNWSKLLAQPQVEQSSRILLLNIHKSLPDTNRVRLMLKLSRFYVNTKGDLDSSLLVAKEALRLSEALKAEEAKKEVLKVLMGILLRRNEIAAASTYIGNLLDIARKKKDHGLEAEIYYLAARSVSTKFPEEIPLKTAYLQKCISISKKSNQFKLEINARCALGQLYLGQGELDQAETEYSHLLAEARVKRYKDLQNIYYGLGETFAARNDTKKEIYYKIQALRLAETAKPTLANRQLRSLLYYGLGESYYSLKMYREVEEMAVRGMEISHENKDYDMYYSILGGLVNSFLFQQKNREALNLSLRAVKEVPPGNNFQQKIINGLIGKSYLSLNEYQMAEPYFLAMDRYVANMGGEFQNKALLDDHLAAHYLTMAEFYLKKKDYQKAGLFVSKYKTLNLKSFSMGHRMKAIDIQIAIDTSMGNFRSAYQLSKRYKQLADSINEKSSTRSVAEMMVKYESQKKDQDILLRQQSIDLLKKQKQIQDNQLIQADLEIRLEKQQRMHQQELYGLGKEKREKDLKLLHYATEQKDSRIILLNKQAELQQASLDKATLLRNVTFIGLALTLAVIGLLYNRNRIKQENNALLTSQKNEIDIKNYSLEKLVDEKEWLLKEVHHRVKNNLQIVMSLLHNQSFYTEDPAALAAITDSRHRVYTISLIHKKLYQGENIRSINMHDYITELVNYLKESFSNKQQIRFAINVEDILLDSSKAVPLGLILNEAITNCIKYAFPKEKNGKISISLYYIDKENIQMKITDNGIGLLENFERLNNSLGMNMITGLSSDLGGRCNIESINGTDITIAFPYEKTPVKKSVLFSSEYT